MPEAGMFWILFYLNHYFAFGMEDRGVKMAL